MVYGIVLPTLIHIFHHSGQGRLSPFRQGSAHVAAPWELPDENSKGSMHSVHLTSVQNELAVFWGREMKKWGTVSERARYVRYGTVMFIKLPCPSIDMCSS